MEIVEAVLYALSPSDVFLANVVLSSALLSRHVLLINSIRSMHTV